MSKRIDVFTEELKKVWTILQQQQVMINAIKDNINAIDKNATDIDSVNKVVPTDIDLGPHCNLILKHDGIEITGQVKKASGIIVVPYYDRDVQNTDIQNASKDVEAKKIIDKIKPFNYDDGNINYPIYIYDNGNGYGWYGCVYCINKQYTIELFTLTAPDIIYTSKLLYDENNDTLQTNETGTFNLSNMLDSTNLKTIFGNQSLVGSDNIDLYRHNIVLNDSANILKNCHIEIISSSSLKCDSLTNLQKLLKLNLSTVYYLYGVTDEAKACLIIWNRSAGTFQFNNGSAGYVTTCIDEITTI